VAFLQKYIFPFFIAVFYWLWSHTWRFRVIEHPSFRAAMNNGPIAFAHWHCDNIVLVRLGRRYHIASLASTSSDGELITRVLMYFGFGIARGSSTRSGVRALVGMLARVKEGYNPAIACDGPKGPALKVKPGIVYVAKKAEIPLVPTGVAKSSALVFNKAWDKTHMPWPFAKVIVSFGEPVETLNKEDSFLTVEIEKRLIAEREMAIRHLMGKIN
jgi:lysophospholipid acyltransferase (LPLAT)-like uncharacterized protein